MGTGEVVDDDEAESTVVESSIEPPPIAVVGEDVELGVVSIPAVVAAPGV